MDENEKEKWKISADKQTYRDLMSIDKRIANSIFNNKKENSDEKNVIIVQSLVRKWLAKKVYR